MFYERNYVTVSLLKFNNKNNRWAWLHQWWQPNIIK